MGYLRLFESPQVGMLVHADLGQGTCTYRIAHGIRTGEEPAYVCELTTDPGQRVVTTYTDLARAVTRAAGWTQITQAARRCQVTDELTAAVTPEEVRAVHLLQLLGVDPFDVQVTSDQEAIDREVAVFRHHLERDL